MKTAENLPDAARFRRSAEHSSFQRFSFQHFSFTQIFSPATPFFPASGPATRSFNGLHPKSKFLACIQRRHVVLCSGWSNPEKTWIYYYETGGGPQYWKPGLKSAPLAAMLGLGYKPLRYRGMAHPAVKPGSSAKEVLTRAVKATADVVPNPTVGEP